MDKTTYAILKGIPENEAIFKADLINKFIGKISILQVDGAIPYLESQKWVKVNHQMGTNPTIELTYKGLLAIREAEEANEKYQADRSLLESANVISQDANKIAERANSYAEEANSISREANRYSRQSNRISFFALIASLLSCVFTFFGNRQEILGLLSQLIQQLRGLMS